MLDKEYFFEKYRDQYGSQTQSQITGLETIINAFEAEPLLDNYKHLAYMLATVKHECADTWQPITERGPYQYFKYLIGKLGIHNLAEANLYKGRGYVQITGKTNYSKFSNILNIDLLGNPELALDPEIATKIMFKGMAEGLFTGHKLSDYFNDFSEDPINARKIINGKDKAELIAKYYSKIFGSFKLI